MSTATHAPPARLSPAAPPRWARVAAHIAALTPLPSALWRVSLVLGFSGGFTERGLVDLDVAGWGWIYLLGLSVLTELAALLTLGLVQPWGETVPRWLPRLGGRPVPTKPVVAAALIGTVVLMALWTPLLLWWTIPHSDMTAAGATVVGILYLPLVAWGPLLAAVTVSYALRHRAAAGEWRPT
ncbi:hypothetical protein [Cryobacterium sp. TMT4-31]|uniref:hypothetical protein n=1 Tax=Cryobacterium sp. TMT4-31 TaxID=1259259 RepID=UPI0018E097F1|nr:hypothetical protein [Cryobacterium sp. TMT4-31]